MAIIVGKNSYVTLDEANDYIENYYTSNDKLRKAWEELEDTDKEVMLLNGARAIESLVLLGKRATRTQSMEFPRRIDHVIQHEVPDNVKYAQIETSISFADTTIKKRQDLINAGVTQFRIGDLSETYGSRSNLSVDAKLGNSSRAVAYMTDYIGGTYSVI